MKTYLEKIKDVYEMSSEGKLLEAFDKYYHPDVVMIEATGETRNGKVANREFQEGFMSTVKEFHGLGINSIASNEDEKTTMVESWMEVTMNDGSRMKMEEVAVQQWLDDLIIKERFYYNASGQK
jgi:hypothetical protein